MSLYAYSANSDGNTVGTGPDVDVQSFRDLYGQQPSSGLSIIVQYYPYESLSDRPYDWSRILAVEVDEPFGQTTKASCHDSGAQADYTKVATALKARQAELRAKYPWVRFWVNLAAQDVRWLQDSTCPPLNPPPNPYYFDVISVDDYSNPMDLTLYAWLAAHRASPQQQLALVAGTYCTDTDGCAQRSYLQGYFAYANSTNNVNGCNLGLGQTGKTGNYDGCPIWMIMGWLSGEYTFNGVNYHGVLTSAAAQLEQTWRNERNVLTKERANGAVAQAFLPLLLNN
jgi:hypothetical protein